MNKEFSFKQLNALEEEIFQIENEAHFEEVALKLFAFQYNHNKVYREYCNLIKKDQQAVNKLTEIPFLPIELFKTHQVITGDNDYELLFESSGTTNQHKSRHYLKKASLYRKSFMEAFNKFYGSPEEYYILALLPNYLENKHSSLIYMVNELIQQSGHKESGFYLDNLQELAHNLKRLKHKKENIFLLGVSFALLDLAEKYPMPLNDAIIMETGGMKGRREELTRQELHNFLKDKFQVDTIHSEYGMAELLSQAYSKGDGVFQSPPWMKVLLREYNDPFHVQKPDGLNELNGGINIVDFANLYSCAFIETKDIGKVYPDGRFEVLGRFDYSDLRGCNLMMIE